jgi:hypothetical protein
MLVITSVDEPRAMAVPGCDATFVPKQHLSSRLLRELWREERVEA